MSERTEDQKVIETVKKAMPAVVSIVIAKETAEAPKSALPRYDSKKSPRSYAKNGKKAVVGEGSGFIVSPEGIIITNRHVIAETGVEYIVATCDGRRHETKIIAKDPINDIAILKIDASGAPFIPIGNSLELQLGQTVIAIGNALAQFDNSISKGIVSGLSRFLSAGTPDEKERHYLRGLIQTDAAINFGNSGGPLLDMEGTAIGINTAVVFGAQNINFAIPINAAKKDLEEIKTHGRIVRPYLGIRYVMLNPEILEETGTPVDRGAWILPEHLPEDRGIAKGSPAEKAGLKENDIIIEFGGREIGPDSNLDELIQNSKPEEVIPITVLRGGDRINLKITLTEREIK